MIPTTIALLTLCAPAGPRTQDPVPPQRATAWPQLPKAEQDRVRSLIDQFRKPAELHASARSKIVGFGAGAAPILMQQVSDRADNLNEQLFATLDELLADEHADLLARELQKPKDALRHYLLRRLCKVDDPGLVPAYLALREDKNEQTAFLAALGLLASGREEGLLQVLAGARTRWAEVSDLVAAVLPRARSAALANSIWGAIANAPSTERMAGLRLLRYVMTPEQAHMLRGYLQAGDHVVKREAVNAARALHGEPPIESLSAFQAIEMAKHWLERL